MSAAEEKKGLTYYDLIRMSNTELDKVHAQGKTPEFKDLVGWEFRGFNTPAFAKLLGFQKFKKGFFLDHGQAVDGEEISGYNVWVLQNGADDPHIAKPSDDEPKRHGFYVVYRVRPEERDNKVPHALLINYGKGRNASFNPERAIRDYLVQVDPDNKDLLLGKAYFAIGPARVFPSFFILERNNESNYKP